jgi:menaquinone reductase, integral membrane subunit
MDSALISRGLHRCSFRQFVLWLSPWFAVLAFGIVGFALCLIKGLNQTNMDNRFAFGLWIFLDLSVIALGAGAFFTGFLLYIMKRDELRAVINSAVVMGFLCYSGAVSILMVDVGQPLRAWFTFWHPNVHSMLTEVTFCLTCYLAVLAIEYIPLVLRNRKLKQVTSVAVVEHEIHRVVIVFAVIGTLLSFFHQGSLGGLYGVLHGRPFSFREGFSIWPSSFFLFLLSAAAVGPSFVIVTTAIVSSLSRKTLVRYEALALLGKVSGILLTIYVILKSIDTLVWINSTSPGAGIPAVQFYSWEPFGSWILFAEIILFGMVPALMLLNRRIYSSWRWLLTGAVIACCGVALNRFVMTIQTLAVPTLSFDEFMLYMPSWQEFAAFAGVVAYGVIVYSLSFRYLNLFPQERELAEEEQEEEVSRLAV